MERRATLIYPAGCEIADAQWLAQAGAAAMAMDEDWEHDKFPVVNLVAKGPQQHSFAGTKLLVSNLHHNVSSNDVKARRECSAAAAAQQPG